MSNSLVRVGAVANTPDLKAEALVSLLFSVLPEKSCNLFSTLVKPSSSRHSVKSPSPKKLCCLCPAVLEKASLPTKAHCCQNQSTSTRHSPLCTRAQVNVYRGNNFLQIARETKQPLGSVRKISIVLSQHHPKNRN